MAKPDRPCATCRHWEVADDRRESAAMAGCAKAGRRVAFDETCTEWTALPPRPRPATISVDDLFNIGGGLRRRPRREGD